VLQKDIWIRHQVADRRAFENIVKFAARNIGSPLSPSGISKALRADGQVVHHATVEKSLDYLTEACVFYKAHRCDIRGKQQLATLEKYYLVDPGLLNLLVGREAGADRGHILENVVYLELLRRGSKVWTGHLRGGEVDFVAKNRLGELEYYQVSWSVSDPATLERELKPLLQIPDNYPKFLLSCEAFPQGQDGVKHLNVFGWLVGGE
jgi:predicted AAA+ superfamily ATPase